MGFKAGPQTIPSKPVISHKIQERCKTLESESGPGGVLTSFRHTTTPFWFLVFNYFTKQFYYTESCARSKLHGPPTPVAQKNVMSFSNCL